MTWRARTATGVFTVLAVRQMALGVRYGSKARTPSTLLGLPCSFEPSPIQSKAPDDVDSAAMTGYAKT